MWKVIAWGLIIYFVAQGVNKSFETMTGVGEAIVYESSCLGGKTEDINKCTEEDGHIYVQKRRFKVDFNHQRVIEDDDLIPFKGQCSVFDSENWHCLSEDESYYAAMRDGSYTDSLYYDIKTNRIIKSSVAVTVYWFYYWKGFFG